MIPLKSFIPEVIQPSVDKMPGSPTTLNNPSKRMDLFSQERLKNIPPEILNVISMAEKILDKKNKSNVSKFNIEYINELVDDIIASNIPNLSPSFKVYMSIKKFVIQYLKRDYNIL